MTTDRPTLDPMRLAELEGKALDRLDDGLWLRSRDILTLIEAARIAREAAEQIKARIGTSFAKDKNYRLGFDVGLKTAADLLAAAERKDRS